jgi:AraC-type DNA-binding domain-containing proteins
MKDELISLASSESYYPYQIPSVLDGFFKSDILYKEHKIYSLINYCFCIWEMKSHSFIENIVNNTIIPDACIDLIIDFSNKEMYFSGFSKNTKNIELTGNIDFLGIRFKPGAFFLLFNTPAEKVMDNMVNFSDIDNISIDEIFKLDNKKQRLEKLENYILSKINNISFGDKNCIELIDKLYLNLDEEILNYLLPNKSDKTIYRYTKKIYGLTPKNLINVLRLHFTMNELFNKDKTLLEIANDCGFYDQSHFIKEIKKYTSISPLSLLDKYVK